jgi:O-antigen ligase
MDRFFFLWAALGAFSENPILGVGVANYEGRSWEFMEKYPVPWRKYRWSVAKERDVPEAVPVHNEYGRMLAEQGIFSLFIFGFLVWSAFRNLRFARENTKDDFVKTVALGTSIYLASMVAYWFFHEYFLEETYIAFLPFAISVIVRRITEDELAGQPDAAAA